MKLSEEQAAATQRAMTALHEAFMEAGRRAVPALEQVSAVLLDFGRQASEALERGRRP